MQKQEREYNLNVIRSGTRVRESVRSLPKGHFEQIRQMFDHKKYSTKQLSTIYERQQLQQKSLPSDLLLRLPVTDDEKLKHTTTTDNNNKSIEQQYRDYLAEYQAFRLKLTTELNEHKALYPSMKSSEQLLKQSNSLSYENYSDHQETLSYTKSLPEQNNHHISRQLAMSSAVNYTDSYDSSSLNRTGSSRQYVSSLQPTLNVHSKPPLPYVTSPITCHVLKRNQIVDTYPSRRLHSSTSLSSTGYDSNSSPSIKSKRNSLATNNSNDLIIHSTCSLSSTSSNSLSNDEQHLSKPWRQQYETNPSFYHDEAFESSTEPSPLITRTEIQINSAKTKPVNHPSSSFILQTTSFPDPTTTIATKEKADRKIRRWNNVHAERVEIVNTPMRIRKYPLASMNSTGFQVVTEDKSDDIKTFTPIIDQHERIESPLPIVENPIYKQLPPKKPPRTFQHEPVNDQKVPSSSSSNSNSPVLDLGTRSVSCMDLTAGVSNALLSSGLLPLETEHKPIPRKSSITSQTSKTKKPEVTLRTPKPKTNMKKGTSEPNLTKRARSKSPFSPRGLLDRFKRILPLSLSKQSLNQNDSDDSTSTSSETNEHIRTSKLDHVSRVKDVYNSINTSNLFIDPNVRQSVNELKTFYEYVVLIIPEQDFGYISHGNGCIISSNLSQSSPSAVTYKYPQDIDDEVTLKYFCYPDQHDTNNNNLLNKKFSQEYFRFTLTNMFGIRQYGYCSRFIHKGKQHALCLVSPYDLIEIYEKILSTATELFLSYKEEYAKKFLEEIYQHRVPGRGDTIHIHTTTVGLYTLKCEFDRRKELIDSITLLSLSTDTIIKIFSSILYEQKIIFIGNELGPLTRLINTFICLLYPFSWPHTYVPILPAIMLDIIQAPTPYIIGILRSCESYLTTNDDLLAQDNSDIVIIDIDNDCIRSINDYLHIAPSTELVSDNSQFQILPKIFKIELKQEISLLRKNRLSLSLDDCQQRLRDVFMSIFVQSCYNYKDYYYENYFHRDDFLQSKQHTIELFLEWFTRTQLFELFIRQKFNETTSDQFAITFDIACEKYAKKFNKQIPQRITAKAVKRKSATRANKQDNRL